MWICACVCVKLTWAGTSWGPHPCPGSMRGMRRELFLQTAQRSEFYSCKWTSTVTSNYLMNTNINFLHTSFLNSLHALLEYWVASGLADNDISPLYNHNTDKERCVTCELNNLPLLVCLWNTNTASYTCRDLWDLYDI